MSIRKQVITDFRQYDFHIHCGNERGGTPRRAFIDALVRRGVVFCGMVDHAEFYIGDDSDWLKTFRANAATKGVKLYEDSLAGLQCFYDEIEELRQEAPLPIVMGLEFRRPEKLSDAYLERPEYFCNCFHITDHVRHRTFGENAAVLIRAFGEKILPAGKPGIINHPFRDVLGPYSAVLGTGETIPPAEYITPDDIRRLVAAAREYDLFVEINLGDLEHHARQGPCQADLLVYLVEQLLDNDAPLSLGSDTHRPPDPRIRPEALNVLRRAGLTPADLAGIVAAMQTAVPGATNDNHLNEDRNRSRDASLPTQ